MGKQTSVRVMIVDDDYLVSEMIRGQLEEVGYVVVGEAMDGIEALEMTQALHPDVILMDIQMPDMDGIEATRRIQERCPTPVVVLTAHETPELVDQASQVGIGAYLVKPPNSGEMERAIAVAMARFNDMMRLRHLNEDLQARNEELDAFAYTVAHDLQNPLSLVVGFAEALKRYRTRMSEDEIQECIENIEQTGRKMSQTIDQLLLLARTRKLEVATKPLDMVEIVKEARSRLIDMIDRYEADIIVPDSWPIALGYAPWVEEIWVNYLANAIKYGGRPPRVELGATVQSDDMVRFWVLDNGRGIKSKDQTQLFTPFTRLSQDDRGSGLGLSIVRRITEKLGGKVGIESAVGRGSTFSFTLPGVGHQRGAAPPSV